MKIMRQSLNCIREKYIFIQQLNKITENFIVKGTKYFHGPHTIYTVVELAHEPHMTQSSLFCNEQTIFVI